MGIYNNAMNHFASRKVDEGFWVAEPSRNKDLVGLHEAILHRGILHIPTGTLGTYRELACGGEFGEFIGDNGVRLTVPRCECILDGDVIRDADIIECMLNGVAL